MLLLLGARNPNYKYMALYVIAFVKSFFKIDQISKIYR